MANLRLCGRGAWMPAQSYFSGDGGQTYRLARNSFEASVLVRTDYLLKYGFDTSKSGAEHLSWRSAMVADGHLSEEDEVTPFESYAYVWGEPATRSVGRSTDRIISNFIKLTPPTLAPGPRSSLRDNRSWRLFTQTYLLPIRLRAWATG